MDVREGRQGVRGLQGRPWTLVSKCCWSHFKLNEDKTIVVLLRESREGEKNYREEKGKNAKFLSIKRGSLDLLLWLRISSQFLVNFQGKPASLSVRRWCQNGLWRSWKKCSHTSMLTAIATMGTRQRQSETQTRGLTPTILMIQLRRQRQMQIHRLGPW